MRYITLLSVLCVVAAVAAIFGFIEIREKWQYATQHDKDCVVAIIMFVALFYKTDSQKCKCECKK